MAPGDPIPRCQVEDSAPLLRYGFIVALLTPECQSFCRESVDLLLAHAPQLFKWLRGASCVDASCWPVEDIMVKSIACKVGYKEGGLGSIFRLLVCVTFKQVTLCLRFPIDNVNLTFLL